MIERKTIEDTRKKKESTIRIHDRQSFSLKNTDNYRPF